MAVDRKYGEIRCDGFPYELNHSNEPVFVLRAQDQFSAILIGEYSAIAAEAGAPAEFLDAIDQVRMDFESWQLHNPDRVKAPD